ncbi:hypothetical protein LRAMOSA11128 [Lichtheimia ramosa]|uniref:Uncharacterized protein n=1 Tax=Lichtheimia ramosa TaxID=688394 RepID=A0A077WVA3_9FUNG|nr:hypothetical protein LRAMOSA11128 [Lichtheimia ramosa]
MSRSVPNDLCQQPTLIASTEKYKQLVHDTTTELVQPIQCILSAWDRRAMALSKCASFESALRDATVMQQLSPTSALGYIREAMIYSEQGKQRHVIDICNHALDVVDTKDPSYGILLQVKIHAQQRDDKRIDFFSELPVEIVMTTLIPMFMNKDDRLDAINPCPYLYVSNLWRDRIIQSFHGLAFVTNEDTEHDPHPQVIKFAQHTRSLYVQLCT